MKKFSELSLSTQLLKSLDGLGYKEMTPVQRESLPIVLEGRDLIAQAKTGSGKTAAFGLGLLQKIEIDGFKIGGLILCPTRELANQVSEELRKLARHVYNMKIVTLCGGTPVYFHQRSLEHGAHVAVGTPGRILDLLKKGHLDIKEAHTLVLDEADRMLDMGFEESMREIMNFMPTKRQTLLFSATFPQEIEEISAAYQNKPAFVKIEAKENDRQIEQVFIDAKENDPMSLLKYAIDKYRISQAVVFCETKLEADDVAHLLRYQGYFADAIHGDLEQKERDEVLTLFTNGSLSFLVATDVAARGIDVKDLEAVINFSLSKEPAVHIHRIGRTGRAGKGIALSFVTKKTARRFENIEEKMGSKFKLQKLNTKASKADSFLPNMSTIRIESGKKNKMRPGDVLGALTAKGGLQGSQVGKINVFLFHTYVAVERAQVKKALEFLLKRPVKGKKMRAKIIR